MAEYVGRALNRDRLREALDHEGVDQRSLNLDGSHGDEAYVLATRPGGWAVFYAEGGQEVARHEFDSEDEACHWVLDLLLRDPTTRRHS